MNRDIKTSPGGELPPRREQTLACSAIDCLLTRSDYPDAQPILPLLRVARCPIRIDYEDLTDSCTGSHDHGVLCRGRGLLLWASRADDSKAPFRQPLQTAHDQRKLRADRGYLFATGMILPMSNVHRLRERSNLQYGKPPKNLSHLTETEFAEAADVDRFSELLGL